MRSHGHVWRSYIPSRTEAWREAQSDFLGRQKGLESLESDRSHRIEHLAPPAALYDRLPEMLMVVALAVEIVQVAVQAAAGHLPPRQRGCSFLYGHAVGTVPQGDNGARNMASFTLAMAPFVQLPELVDDDFLLDIPLRS